MSTSTETQSRSKGRSSNKRPGEGARWNNAVSSPDEQYQLKKQAVITEAAKAFGRRGYKNVSLDEIALALNVTKPALYYYFKNKQELIYECHELVMQVGDQVLQEAMATDSSGYVKITTFIKNYLALLTNGLGAPAILYDLAAMSPADQKKIKARRRKFNQQLRQIIEDGIQDGSIAPCDPKLVVFWFMSAIAALPLWYDAEGVLGGEEIADAYIEFLTNGIAPIRKAGAA